ncbi:MAG TPA: hypothetical protein VFA55_09260, partial [Candidatus Kapabacteria bacterium]|nr:hypothetical protein [Candidatus Kapabacteria bacterium]
MVCFYHSMCYIPDERYRPRPCWCGIVYELLKVKLFLLCFAYCLQLRDNISPRLQCFQASHVDIADGDGARGFG